MPLYAKKNGYNGIITGDFDILRSDYKVGKPGGEVAENIKINISIEVTKI
jgi:hypothetical protein